MWLVGRNCGYTSIGRVECEPTTEAIMEACDTINKRLGRARKSFDMVMTEAELNKIWAELSDDESKAEHLASPFRFAGNVAWPVVIGGE